MDTPNTPHSLYLPWRVGRTNSGMLAVVTSEPSTFGLTCAATWDLPRGEDLEFAEAIVHRVNHFDSLLSALKDALEVTELTYDSGLRRDGVNASLIGKLRAVIKAGEGEQS